MLSGRDNVCALILERQTGNNAFTCSPETPRYEKLKYRPEEGAKARREVNQECLELEHGTASGVHYVLLVIHTDSWPSIKLKTSDKMVSHG